MYQNLPLVSIITPSFQQGRFIDDTIQSVLTQDYPKIEYIVIDAQSTDDTIEILESYGQQFVWLSEADNGQANAINKGLNLSHGDIVTWLNSDDLLKPGAVRAIVDKFNEYPEAGLVFGDLDLVDENRKMLQSVKLSDILPEELLFGNVIGQPNVFIRKDVFETTGYINEKYHYVFDLDLWLRIAFRYTTHHISQSIAEFRLHGESKSVLSRQKFASEWLMILSQFFEQKDLPHNVKLLKRRATGKAYAGFAFSLLNQGKYREALPHFLRAVLLDHTYIHNRGVRASLIWGLIGFKPFSERTPINDDIENLATRIFESRE